jgi:DNA gyrase subunit A
MQLGSLTSMERADIESEYEEVQATIERLEEILESESELLAVIKGELREVRDEYADERRTTILDAAEAGTVTHEDLIPEEECVVVVTEDDYIKRMPASEFDAQNRGGKGIIGVDPKEGDRVSAVFAANTHDYLLCFTNRGQVYQLKTYEVPEMGRTARGKSAINLLDLDDGEEITAVVNTDDLEGDEFLTMITREGYVKRTPCEAFENILSTGIIAAKLEDEDALVDVEVTDGTMDLVISTQQGMTIRFDEEEARAMGRSARGVNGIELQEGDAVAGIAATAVADDCDLLTVTGKGYGKRTPLSEYRVQSRYGKGLIDIKTDERNGHAVATESVDQDDHLFAMSERGQIMRTRVADISTQGRNTMGVIVMRLEEGDSVASVEVLPGGSDGGEDETDAEAGQDADSAGN